ncbi:MAG: hypothetical protein GEU99_14350 [Luteitalea sp.]|nr:hypothetical protein [Luteitalea sp.]
MVRRASGCGAGPERIPADLVHAHLRIAPAVLGQPDPGAAYSAVIQLGTLLAVTYFARDLFVVMPRALVRDRSSPEARLPLHIAIGTLPIVAAGVLGKERETPRDTSARRLAIVSRSSARTPADIWSSGCAAPLRRAWTISSRGHRPGIGNLFGRAPLPRVACEGKPPFGLRVPDPAGDSRRRAPAC